MGLTVVTSPTTEPLTLAEARAHCRIDQTEDSGLLAGYILAAREFAENYTRRKFVTQTLDYTLEAWPYKEVDSGRGYYECRYRVELPVPDVQSITYVKYLDSNGALQTLAATQYVLRKDGPVAYLEPAKDATWPDVSEKPALASPTVVAAPITVRFVAGSDAVPDSIRVAIQFHVEIMYDRDPNARESLEFARDSLLNPYRYIRVL